MKIQPFFVFLNKRIYRPSFASDGLKRSCLQAQTIFKSKSSKWRESEFVSSPKMIAYGQTSTGFRQICYSVFVAKSLIRPQVL